MPVHSNQDRAAAAPHVPVPKMRSLDLVSLKRTRGPRSRPCTGPDITWARYLWPRTTGGAHRVSPSAVAQLIVFLRLCMVH
jgi:hypothetical protein